MSRSIWNRLTIGVDVNKKQMFWFTICPGVGFKAISLGRTRRTLFGRTEYQILYRNYNKNSQGSRCYIDWVSKSQIIERE